jgi:hypothetical protein
MTELPFGFTGGGLFCYQSSDDPTVFYYVPNAPVPDVSAGMPAVRQTSTTAGQLLLDVAWLPAAGAVNALEQEIALRYPEFGALVEVRMAPATDLIVDAIDLALVATDGTRQVLATSQAIRTPPYSAALTATFDSAHMAPVRAALEDGVSNALVLDLRYALNVAVKAAAHIDGSVAAMMAERADQYSNGFTDDDAVAVLDDALASGALTAAVTVTPAGELGQAQADDALSTARQSAVRLIVAGYKPPTPPAPPPPAAKKPWWSGRHQQQEPQQPEQQPEQQQHQETIHASASLDARLRVPPDDGPTPWLLATTDLGAWIAASRQTS